MIGFALALMVAIPSPVPAARAATHAQGPLVLRANIDSQSAVVAFGGSKPAAVVVEYAGGRWKPIAQHDAHVTPLLPKRGAVTKPGRVQIAANFSARGRILTAAMWLDAKALKPRPKGTTVRFIARADVSVATGRHYAIAFVGAAGAADAAIWSFRVR